MLSSVNVNGVNVHLHATAAHEHFVYRSSEVLKV